MIETQTPYRTESIDGLAQEKPEKYDYPDGLKLQPGSEQHNKIVNWVMRRARNSYSMIEKRFPAWDKIDETCTAYIRTDDSERLRIRKDSRKPVSIVLPITFTIHQTLLTHWTTSRLINPFFRYKGQAPEDTTPAILMEKVVDANFQRAKCALNIYTMWSDALKYGFGGAACCWERKMGKKMGVRDTGFYSTSFGPQPQWWPTGQERVPEPTVKFEGNCLVNIDPRRYLPDPNVPVHEVQRGEYTARVDRTNYNNLAELERQGKLFNVKYLKRIGDCRSKLFPKDRSPRDRWEMDDNSKADDTRPCDVIWMDARLIPKDCELGDSEDVEMWSFGVAADGLLIQAEKSEDIHDMFGIAISAPNYDGHSTTPISDLEVTYGSQHLCNWLINSHVNSKNALIKNKIVYDPSRINSEDMNDPGRHLIRARRRAFDSNMKDSIFQIPLNDVTAGNINEAQFVMDFMKMVTGATDGLMGSDPNAPERRSAQEAAGLRQSALARVEKTAMISALQAENELATMFAENTQQYMSQETYAKTVGTWPQELAMIYGPNVPIPVGPNQIVCDYDILTTDRGINGGQDLATMQNLFNTVVSNPELMQLFDVGRMFMGLADVAGYENTSEFLRSGAGMAPQVMGQEQIAQEAQAGNIVPVGQASLG